MTKEQILKTLDTKVSDGTITEILREIVTPVVIAPKVGNTIMVDAYALGQLAKILEKKDTSIFDVVLKNGTGIEPVNFGRVVGWTHINVHVYDPFNDEIRGFTISYTSTQYEGLAAVQEAGESQWPGDGMTDGMPALALASGVLLDNMTGYFIMDPEGHKISITVADEKLATVAIQDEIDPRAAGIKVPFEEIQKLIGLPIAV